MESLKIVIISRAIFPMMAPRPLRATELAEELARQGHTVTLYGVLGSYDYRSFEKKYNISVKNLKSSSFTTFNSDSIVLIPLWKKMIIRLLHKLCEFPDILLCSRVFQALKKERDVDMLITVAVPYPIHWGATYAKTHLTNLKETVWISDCGDPYMGSPFVNHPFYFKYIEKWWCRSTDYITVPIEDARSAYYAEFRDKIRVIPQGFDFSSIILPKYVKNLIPHFAYSGMVYPQRRDPRVFLDYLCQLARPFKFVIYTKQPTVFTPYIKYLKGKIEIRPYIPHKELIKELSQMNFLLNIKNESSVQQPSKLIDYYLAKRPIIEITSSFKEESAFDEFMNGNYTNSLICPDIESYNVVTVASKFIDLYKEHQYVKKIKGINK